MSAIIHPGSVRTLPRRRVRAVPRRKGLSLAGFALFSVSTIGLGFAFSSAMSLAGFMLVERARSQAIQADQRAIQAETSIAELRGEVDRLRSAHSVQRWASVNNLAPSYRSTDETTTN